MVFFSNEIAFTLQYITFPFEVFGLTLATIELRFPHTAKRIHDYLLKDKAWTEVELDRGFIDTIRKSKIVLIVYILYSVLVFTMAYFKGDVVIAVAFIFVPLILIPVLASFMWLTLKGYGFLTDWVPDRSVGTLGIIIAGFGVLGEAYQFTTQLVI